MFEDMQRIKIVTICNNNDNDKYTDFDVKKLNGEVDVIHLNRVR